MLRVAMECGKQPAIGFRDCANLLATPLTRSEFNQGLQAPRYSSRGPRSLSLVNRVA